MFFVAPLCAFVGLGTLSAGCSQSATRPGDSATREPPPASAAAGVAATAPATMPAGRLSGYPRFDALQSRLNQLANTWPQAVRIVTLATTAAGHPVLAVEIAAPGDAPPARRPAVLLVAGLDAAHRAGPAVALEVMENLLADAIARSDGEAAKALTRQAFYLVPCANPDRYERLFVAASEAVGGNLRPTDDDRDDRIDEDPREDLNGDGAITLMRVRGKNATYVTDADEPRLLRPADAVKGEHPVYELYTEGIDNDGDGEYNEDGSGATNLSGNFPHLYQPHLPDSGPHQLSEPETRALADFVIARPNIAAVVVFGPHDNVVKVPSGRDRDPTGRSYRDLHPDDVGIHKQIAESLCKITGLKGAPATRIEGAFHAWCYAQRGLPAFATTLWWPLDEPPASQPASAAASQVAASQAATQPATQPSAGAEPAVTDAEQPAAAQRTGRGSFRRRPPRGGNEAPPGAGGQPAAEPAGAGPPSGQESPRFGGRRPRGGSGGGPPDMEAPETTRARMMRGEPPPAAATATEAVAADISEERKWLKYSDERRGGAGFRPWTPFQHPTLGDVEIGGFLPMFKVAPPDDELPALARRQTDALLELAGRLPCVRVWQTVVKSPGDGVWDVEIVLENTGYLPTASAMARAARTAKPIILRPDLPRERILAGMPMERIGFLGGAGGRARVRWLVAGAAGEVVRFKLFYEPIGESEHVVELKPTPIQPPASASSAAR